MVLNLRTHAPGDTPRILSVVTAAMPVDVITAEWFTENVLLDANFDPAGLIVAESGGDVVGFVFAVRSQGGAGIPVPDDGGWITIFAVHPDHQRQRIGTRLITAAKDFLRAGGSRWVQVSGYPPSYFVPGVDPEAYPAAVAMLESLGFDTRSRPVAMDASLATYRTPETVLEVRAERVAEGYTFGVAGPDDLPEVIRHAATDLAPDWGEALRESVIRHRRPDRVIVARDPKGAVVGFATYGAYRGVPDRFGPFGVLDTRRGTGLGKILLHETLTRMRAEGAHAAWFLWTGEQSPAGHLYKATGFGVSRRFHVMQHDFDGEQQEDS